MKGFLWCVVAWHSLSILVDLHRTWRKKDDDAFSGIVAGSISSAFIVGAVSHLAHLP